MEFSSRPTFLLTGATGLLGRFVLARLLQSRCDVAVLVRPSAQWSAQQRLEDALGTREQSGWLPRPRVLAGDLSDNRLRLADADIQWLGTRRLCVIHCAASIRFQRDEASDEPYRTNVHGTQHLLEFCRNRKVEGFHYVSTAYVGSRTINPPAREGLPDADAVGGNDYEQSKIAAERLVAACTHIGPKTIHRPSIIVGDSQTGFTSTYHGFYAPLNICYQLAKQFGFTPEAGSWFRQQLGLAPDDTKNLVPVDWVAEAITQVVVAGVSTAIAAGDALVLHWTNPSPVPCASLQDAIAGAVERVTALQSSSVLRPNLALPNPAEFRQSMQVYESYFNSDPIFDNSRAKEVCPHLPCPEVDAALLAKLSQFALAHHFGWPKPQPSQISHAGLVDRLRGFPTLRALFCHSFVLCLLGPGSPESLQFAEDAGRWYAISRSEIQLAQSSEGGPPLVMTTTISILADWFARKTSLALAFEQGCCIMEGKLPENWLTLLEHWMEDVRTK